MSEYRYDLKDIQKRTGLPSSYLARSSAGFADLFFDQGLRSNGMNNKTLFNESGAVLFDRIKQLKESGLSRRQIRDKLEADLQGSRQKSDETGGDNRQESASAATVDTWGRLIEALEKQHHLVLQAKDETIAELKAKQLLLTDGRSPGEVRSEWNKKRENGKVRQGLLAELRGLQSRWFFSKPARQRQIVDRLGELDA